MGPIPTKVCGWVVNRFPMRGTEDVNAVRASALSFNTGAVVRACHAANVASEWHEGKPRRKKSRGHVDPRLLEDRDNRRRHLSTLGNLAAGAFLPVDR